ncbi:MFS transporter [Sulfobacillus thermosulfidooxidans]|uniref:MFS transporter n=1 Tax=Sulfobacillus thermosulfidooxidans TaxID=28034 RepID=UPI0006B454E3|nr:MFS transporter [Sulfobacillus thermosulfidooxidans]
MKRRWNLNLASKSSAVIYLILILTFLARANSSMMQSNNPLYAHSLGAQLAEVGLTTSVYAVVTMMVRFGYSARVNLHDVPRVMTVGFVLLTLAISGVLLSHNFVEFLLAVALAGVSTALIMPHLLSLMGALSPQEDREKNLSYYSLALSTSLVVAPILGTLILTHVALKGLYVLLLTFALIGLGVMVFNYRRFQQRLLRDEKPKGFKLRSALSDLVHNPTYMRSFASLFLFNLSFAAAMSYGGLDVKDRFGLSYSLVELVLTSFFVASLLGRLVVSRFVRQKKLERKATWMFWSLGIGGVGLGLMGWAPSLIVFLIGFWLLAWPHAVLFPLVSMRIASSVDRHLLVAANTIAQSSFDLSGTFGPLALSLVISRGHIGWGFWLIGVIQFVGMGIMATEARKEFLMKRQVRDSEGLAG